MRLVTFERIGHGWLRRDETGHTWVVNEFDTSRDTRNIHGNFPDSEYHSACTQCYLGHAHSIALHNSNLRGRKETHGHRT